MNESEETPRMMTARAFDIHVKSLVSRNGERIEFKKGDIVLIVGPNNSGKTSFLNQLSAAIQSRESLPGSFMFADVALHIAVPPGSLAVWLKTLGPQVGVYQDRDPIFLVRGSGWNEADITRPFSRGEIANLHQLAVSYLQAGDRTQLLQPQPKISVSQSPATRLQRVLLDERLEEHLARVVKKAFGSRILLDRGYGPQTRFYLGDANDVSGHENRLSAEYQKAVEQLPPMDAQGDGMRAFVGIMAEVLTSKAFFILIDEPELFLHPPQARLLAADLSRELPDDTQLFLATHSGDFVRGLINAAPSRLRILRVQRNPSKPAISEISRDRVATLWKDPLLRVSNVLDGLFHEKVFVCEGDVDCRFYSALVDAIAIASPDGRVPDCAFVHGGGKGKTPIITEALAAVNVPVSPIFDLDVLSDVPTLSRTVGALGGDWSELRADCEQVASAIASRKPETSAVYVKAEIERLVASIATEDFPRDVQKRITTLMKSANPWTLMKQGGISYLPPGAATIAWNRLDQKLRALGIFLVPEGEVEGFYRLSGKGPQWIEGALSEDLITSPNLSSARKFVSDLVARP